VGKYLIEEAYEVLESIEKGTAEDQKEELGDLLFQILFMAQLAEENGEFAISDVLDTVREKMIRRHPHVFGMTKVRDVEDIKANWDDIKRQVEMKGKRGESFLGRVPLALPALARAQKLTEETAKVGFDWEDMDGVLAKTEEEMTEFRSALASGERERIREELGDLLFALVNVARFSDIAAEEALRASIHKFVDRFSYIETALKARGKSPAEASLDEMDALWNEAKMREGRKS
jgi:tetrapyrrole methylase family protein/MazG family protein